MEEFVSVPVMIAREQLANLQPPGRAIEIVTRTAKKKYKPFIDAVIGSDAQKAEQVAEKLLGGYGLEDVRGTVNSMRKNLHTLSTTCKNMSVQVDQIYKLVGSVQNLAYLNAGLGLVNLGVNIAGFAMISTKLNTLSSEIQKISVRVNQIANIQKNNIIARFQKLTMLFNQMSTKLQENAKIELDELEKLIIEIRAFLSEMILNLNDKALQEEILLEIVYTLVPAYTSLLCEFVKTYYFQKQNVPANYELFLKVYDELEEAHFRQNLFDYYMLTKKLSNLDVVDILNAQSLLGVNGRVQVEDELDLVRVLKNKEKYDDFERKVDSYVQEQVKAAVAAA
ncbi:MAG: hypothetical protein IJV40_01775 [Oscillospiraceae bacterium]|nr:hypothetical protein [Oscillospiraceae bacterium]